MSCACGPKGEEGILRPLETPIIFFYQWVRVPVVVRLRSTTSSDCKGIQRSLKEISFNQNPVLHPTPTDAGPGGSASWRGVQRGGALCLPEAIPSRRRMRYAPA